MTLKVKESSINVDEQFIKGNQNQSILVSEDARVCPDCGGTEFEKDSSRAEISCKRCGLIIEENLIDQGPEWRAFDNDQRVNRTRVGAPATPNVHDKGLPTVIDYKNKDAHGRNIPDRNKAQIERIRRWQIRSRISGAGERNLAFALSE